MLSYGTIVRGGLLIKVPKPTLNPRKLIINRLLPTIGVLLTFYVMWLHDYIPYDARRENVSLKGHPYGVIVFLCLEF